MPFAFIYVENRAKTYAMNYIQTVSISFLYKGFQLLFSDA